MAIVDELRRLGRRLSGYAVPAEDQRLVELFRNRAELKKELTAHLRTHRPIRRSRHATAKADLRGRIPDTVSISERPANADDRAVPGHWNDDRFGSLADLATQPRPAKAGDAPAGSALLARVYSRADRMSKVTEQCLCRGRALTPTQL